MQNIDVMLEPLRALLQQVGAFMPRLALAAGVLLLGWLVAKAFRFSVVKALRALNFHVLTERAGIDGFLQQGGAEKDTTELFGWIAYALVILASLIIAFNSLGLTQVTDLLGRVLLFVPRLLVALLVVVFGSYFARFAGQAVSSYCRAAKISDGELLGRIEAAAADPAPADHPLKLRNIEQPAARDRWTSAVKEVLASIAKGSVRKVVLSRDVVMEGDEDLDPWAMLRLIRARDPRGLRFCLRFDDGAAFVGATPERLLVQRGNEVACDCLAGTIMRGATAGEAEANAAKLLASEKDAREHRIVLEEILEAIAPHARSLDSPESPSVLMLAEVLHLWSPVRATLRGGADLAAIVSRLQPTPAVGGSPRLAAMDILRILEGRPRGWYAGLVGTIGPDHADFAVAIRSGLVKGRRLTAFGGAGIVRGSDPQAEWDETARKAASFIHLFAESA